MSAKCPAQPGARQSHAPCHRSDSIRMRAVHAGAPAPRGRTPPSAEEQLSGARSLPDGRPPLQLAQRRRALDAALLPRRRPRPRDAPDERPEPPVAPASIFRAEACSCRCCDGASESSSARRTSSCRYDRAPSSCRTIPMLETLLQCRLIGSACLAQQPSLGLARDNTDELRNAARRPGQPRRTRHHGVPNGDGDGIRIRGEHLGYKQGVACCNPMKAARVSLSLACQHLDGGFGERLERQPSGA